MYIKTEELSFPCRDYHAGADTVRFELNGPGPKSLGPTVELCADDGFVMCTHTVSEWQRWETQGNTLVLTNLPEPEPIPEPEPQPDPPVDELTMTQLAVAELAQTVEDNNTANQLAIAELAEALLGGST